MHLSVLGESARAEPMERPSPFLADHVHACCVSGRLRHAALAIGIAQDGCNNKKRRPSERKRRATAVLQKERACCTRKSNCQAASDATDQRECMWARACREELPRSQANEPQQSAAALSLTSLEATHAASKPVTPRKPTHCEPAACPRKRIRATSERERQMPQRLTCAYTQHNRVHMRNPVHSRHPLVMKGWGAGRRSTCHCHVFCIYVCCLHTRQAPSEYRTWFNMSQSAQQHSTSVRLERLNNKRCRGSCAESHSRVVCPRPGFSLLADATRVRTTLKRVLVLLEEPSIHPSNQTPNNNQTNQPTDYNNNTLHGSKTKACSANIIYRCDLVPPMRSSSSMELP